MPKLTKWQDLQRFKKFRELLSKGWGQIDAAVKAGYSKHYARCYASAMARKAYDSLKDQAEIQGVDKEKLVKWLLNHLEAKMPKWNRVTKSWDYFQNADAQEFAWDRLREIVEPTPPQEHVLTHRRGVDSPPPETREEWVERTIRERSERLEAATRPTNGRAIGPPFLQ